MRGTILLADRLGVMREALVEALSERGFRLLHASTPAEVLEQAAGADLILIGSKLTEERGLDVLRELRAQPQTRRVPVIIHTPNPDPAYEQEAKEAGAERVLGRPFDYNALIDAIEKHSLPSKDEAIPGRRYIQARNEQEIVRFLAGLLDKSIPSVRCEYDPHCPSAYAYPLIEDAFGLKGQESVDLLEDLVTEGLLERRLAHKVHLCPSCGWHTLNFVEVCPLCQSIDIEVESVVHHFACAYVGPWSEFKHSVDLVCPKCEQQLRHLGLDYEKPSDTYVCRSCEHVFTDSLVEAEDLRCGHVTPASELTPRRIYEYVPTPKTSRAVEYGRISGLEIRSVLFEDRSRTFRQDFLIFEIDREIYRARRYDSALAMVLVSVEGLEGAPAVADSVDVARVRAEVFEQIASTLRDLDVLSSVNGSWAAILLPETNLQAAMIVAERVQALVAEFQSINIQQVITTTVAVGELLAEQKTGMEFFEYMHGMLLWALKNHPGAVVSAETWKDEASHA